MEQNATETQAEAQAPDVDAPEDGPTMPPDETPVAETTPEPSGPIPGAPPEMGFDAPPPAGAPRTAGGDADSLARMLDLPLSVTVELGSTTMQLGEALALQTGSIIELNRLPGEPLDMHINDRLVARGEVILVNDALGLRITHVIGQSTGNG